MAYKGLWHGNFPEEGNNVLDSKEVCDLTSDAVINYIGQILLEEDIDNISIHHEGTAIREIEKSFYDLLSSPTLIEYHQPQNNNTTHSASSNTIESASENDVLLYSKSEPLLIKDDHIFTQVQRGEEEAMKFLPAVEKLFIGLESNKIEFPEKPKKYYISENKAICYETSDKKCARKDREPDPLEGRVGKQQAVYFDEPERNENLDQFLLSRGREYVKEVISVREVVKQEMKNGSPKHQADMSKKEHGNGLVNLHSLLIHCSEAISVNDYSRASELIKLIRKHATPKGDRDQRLAYYSVNALEARLAGTGSDIYCELPSNQGAVTDFLKALRVYHAVCPSLRASYYFINQTILNVSKDATKVHIIDFGIHMGFKWPSLFERLSSLRRTPPKIRITGIEFPQKGFRPSKLVEETGRRLSKYAQRFNIRLKYQGIASKWENIRIEDLKIEKDEILVVNCLYGLEKLADETIDMSCPRDKVLSMIREIKPRVFIQGIISASYSTPFYTSRFKEVLSKFSTLLDIWESNLPRESEARLYLEQNLVSPKPVNAIACEGSERLERPETYRQWQARNSRAGFVQLPVELLIKKKIQNWVRELYHKEFVVDEENKWLLLGWKGTILFGLSTWKPNEHE